MAATLRDDDENNFTLKELLGEFLKGKLNEMPQLEARVMSLDPLKITDDDVHFFEIKSDAEKLRKEAKTVMKKGTEKLRLVLIDWTFSAVLDKTAELAIDIKTETQRFEVIPARKGGAGGAKDADVSPVLEDVDIRELADKKRLTLVEAPKGKAAKKAATNVAAKKVNAFGQATEDDLLDIGEILMTSKGLEAPNIQAVRASAPAPVDDSEPLQNTFGLPSPRMITNKTYEIYGKENANHASLSLLDSSKEEAKLGKRSPNAIHLTEVFQESQNRLGNQANTRRGQPIKVTDLYEGFRKGTISWDKIVFNKETVDYLRRNIDILLQED